MTSSLYQLSFYKIAVTAILYYIGSIIGLELTSSNSIASFFWPAAGIALASLFMFGPIAIFGIIIGSLLNKIFLIGDLQSLSLLSSLAPVLQAYVTYKVLNRLFKGSFSLSQEKDIIRFFLLIPIFSLISSVFSILALYYSQLITESDILSAWFIWWIGDSFGVLIITPLFFALFSQKNEWKKRRASVGLSLSLLSIICFLMIQFAQNQEHEELEQRLLQTNRTFNTELENTFQQYEKNLQAINIFFLSTYHATPNEIKGFLKKLNLKKDDASYGYGWFGFADLINTKVESQYSFYTLKPYQFELNKSAIQVIQEQYEECTIGSYLEVHNQQNIIYSLYRNIEASISSIDNLCASEHLGGVAYTDIDLDFLLKKIANKLNLKHVSIQLIGTQNNQDSLLFKYLPKGFDKNIMSRFMPNSESLITYKNTFWTLKLQGSSQYVNFYSSWNTWWLLLSSLLFTAASTLGLLSLTAKKLHTEFIINEKSGQLKKINDQLSSEIQHQQEQQILIKMQSRILEMIAKDEPLSLTLNQLCLYAENQFFEGGNAFISAYNANKQTFSLVASTNNNSAAEQLFFNLSLNNTLNPSIEALKTKKQQLITPLDSSLQEQLPNIQSYWAIPILSHSKEILGVLSIILADARSPSIHEQKLIAATTALASISFDRDKNIRQLYKLSNAVESSPNGIVITSLKGIIEYANPYFCNYIGYLENNIIGEDLNNLVQDANDFDKQEFDWDYSLSLGESQREYMGIKPNGDVYWCKQSIASMYEKHSSSQHVLSIHQDITDEHIAKKFLTQQSSHDSLTGIYSQSEFKLQLKKLIDQPYLGNNHTIAYLDLDHFKRINQQCGHPAGDQLLRAISLLIEKQLRRTDFLARIDGDQFGIIFEQCPSDKAKSILNGIIQSIADYEFIWHDQTYKISASVGLVEIDEQDVLFDEILKRVETACFLAKKEGRKHVHLHHIDAQEQQIDIIKHNWLNTLTEALNNDHFMLFVQPILNLDSKQIETFQVLLRLRGEHNEIIPSRRFMSDAERLNLMPKIDRWVILKTFEWLNKNLDNTSQFIINLSGQTLDITFIPWLNQLIKKENIDASRLCFEITEAVAVIDLKHTQAFINSLKRLGCSFSLDDFGNNLSSFSYLKNLSIDTIKIDGQLIKGIEHNLIDRAMVKSINEIAHIIGIKTIADYVANEHINKILNTIGIDYTQGSNIGKPLALTTPLKSDKTL